MEIDIEKYFLRILQDKQDRQSGCWNDNSYGGNIISKTIYTCQILGTLKDCFQNNQIVHTLAKNAVVFLENTETNNILYDFFLKYHAFSKWPDLLPINGYTDRLSDRLVNNFGEYGGHYNSDSFELCFLLETALNIDLYQKLPTPFRVKYEALLNYYLEQPYETIKDFSHFLWATNIHHLIIKDNQKKKIDKIANILNTKEIKNGYWVLDGIKDRPSQTPVLRSNEYFSCHLIINLSKLLNDGDFNKNIYDILYHVVSTILKEFNINYQWISNSYLVGRVKGDVYQTCLFLRALNVFSKINKQSYDFVYDKINKSLLNYDSSILKKHNKVMSAHSENSLQLIEKQKSDGISLISQRKSKEEDYKFGQPKLKQIPKVTFTTNQVHFLDTEILNKDYPFILLEFIILEGKIHWLWGFVLFGSWANLIEKHPKTQFGNYFSKINKKVRDCGFYIEHMRGGDEWEINLDKTKNHVDCNLFKANDDYTDAKVEFKKGNMERTLERLNSAIHPSEYNHIKYVRAYKLLITCIFRLSYEKISEDTLNEVVNFLRWYKRRLENAIFSIKHVYIVNNKFSESEVEYELKKMENELDSIKSSYKAICNKVVISQKDKAYEELLEFILNLKMLTEKVGEPNEKMKEAIFEYNDFIRLKNNRIIKELFKTKISELQHLSLYTKDKEGTEDYLLYSIIKKGINLDICDNSYSLFKYLKSRLTLKINNFKKI